MVHWHAVSAESQEVAFATALVMHGTAQVGRVGTCAIVKQERERSNIARAVWRKESIIVAVP